MRAVVAQRVVTSVAPLHTTAAEHEASIFEPFWGAPSGPADAAVDAARGSFGVLRESLCRAA